MNRLKRLMPCVNRYVPLTATISAGHLRMKGAEASDIDGCVGNRGCVDRGARGFKSTSGKRWPVQLAGF